MNDQSPIFYTLQPSDKLRNGQIQLWIQKILKSVVSTKQQIINNNSAVYMNQQLNRIAEPKLINAINKQLLVRQLGKIVPNGIQIQLVSAQEGYIQFQKILSQEGRLNDIMDFTELQEIIQDSTLQFIDDQFLLDIIQIFIREKRCEKVNVDGIIAYKFCDFVQ